jgi:hypothetical protein
MGYYMSFVHPYMLDARAHMVTIEVLHPSDRHHAIQPLRHAGNPGLFEPKERCQRLPIEEIEDGVADVECFIHLAGCVPAELDGCEHSF